VKDKQGDQTPTTLLASREKDEVKMGLQSSKGRIFHPRFPPPREKQREKKKTMALYRHG